MASEQEAGRTLWILEYGYEGRACGHLEALYARTPEEAQQQARTFLQARGDGARLVSLRAFPRGFGIRYPTLPGHIQ